MALTDVLFSERTMSYTLPPDVHDQVKQHVASGHYASEDDVLRAALRALAFHNEEIAAIRAGVDDMEAGRLRPFDDVDSDIRRRFGFGVPDER